MQIKATGVGREAEGCVLAYFCEGAVVKFEFGARGTGGLEGITAAETIVDLSRAGRLLAQENFDVLNHFAKGGLGQGHGRGDRTSGHKQQRTTEADEADERKPSFRHR